MLAILWKAQSTEGCFQEQMGSVEDGSTDRLAASCPPDACGDFAVNDVGSERGETKRTGNSLRVPSHGSQVSRSVDSHDRLSTWRSTHSDLHLPGSASTSRSHSLPPLLEGQPENGSNSTSLHTRHVGSGFQRINRCHTGRFPER